MFEWLSLSPPNLSGMQQSTVMRCICDVWLNVEKACHRTSTAPLECERGSVRVPRRINSRCVLRLLLVTLSLSGCAARAFTEGCRGPVPLRHC